MEVVYKNYRIKYDKGTFTLYSSDEAIGYFTTIRGALVHIYTKEAKKNKKPDKDLLGMIHEYDELNKELRRLSTLIYKPIKELNEKINGTRSV